jgi:hypothetical protein
MTYTIVYSLHSTPRALPKLARIDWPVKLSPASAKRIIARLHETADVDVLDVYRGEAR